MRSLVALLADASGAAGATSAGAGAASATGAGGAESSADGGPALTGAESHAAQKELGAVERRMQKLERQTGALHTKLAEHDQSDYVGLAKITAELREVEGEIESLEERWLELSELLG